MGRRERLTLKQKAIFLGTGVILWIPALAWMLIGMDRFSPRHAGMIGIMSLLIMVPLYALITEKWIRKLR